MSGWFKGLVLLVTIGLVGCASAPPPAEPNPLLCEAYQQRTVELHKLTRNAYFNHYGYSLDRRGAEVRLLLMESIMEKFRDYQPEKGTLTLVLRDAQVGYEQAMKLAEAEGCSTGLFAPSPFAGHARLPRGYRPDDRRSGSAHRGHLAWDARFGYFL